MKKVDIASLPFISAGHEDTKRPGVVKKVLFTKDNFTSGGHIQMINWAKLPVGRKFNSHYHEDMDEVFIILTGKVKIQIGSEENIIGEKEAVLIPVQSVHCMENISKEDVHYLVIGSSLGKGGKTRLTNRNTSA